MAVMKRHLIGNFLLCLLMFWGSYCSAETIYVGVREDAAPFSYKIGLGPPLKPGGFGPLHDGGYDGYVVDICDAALSKLRAAKSDLEIKTVGVDSVTRFEFFGDSPKSRIDILCDAATITGDRLAPGNFSANGLLASPPIYLSGVSFAKLSTSLWPNNLCETSILGVVRETSAEATGIGQIVDSGVLGRHTGAIKRAMQTGNDAPQGDEVPQGKSCNAQIILRAKSHPELASLLCDGKLLFYAGDREIVRANLENIKSTGKQNCSFELAPETYTDERYAVLSKVPNDPALAVYILQFNQILSDLILNRSILQRSFQRSFSSQPTVKLKTLFWGLSLCTDTQNPCPER